MNPMFDEMGRVIIKITNKYTNLGNIERIKNVCKIASYVHGYIMTCVVN